MRERKMLWGILVTAVFAPSCGAGVTLKELQALDEKPQEMVYRTVGRRKLHVQVYRPKGHKPTDRRAAVVTIHGGGWTSPGPFHFVPHCRYFASRGAVAGNVEYRLVTPGAVRILDCISDCKAAVRFVRAHADKLGVDPNRIAVAGDSAGGHLAACTGMLPDLDKPEEHKDVSSRADAMVLYNPSVDLPALPWMNAGRDGIKPRPGTTPPKGETWKDRAKKVSPIYYVKKGLPPALLIHGTADGCVPIEQIDRFDKALKAAGNRCDYRRMKGWKHAFMILPPYGTEQTIVETLRMTDEFLASLGYLKGKPTIVVGQSPATKPKDKAKPGEKSS